MAETLLREYIAYARAPADETAPLLYMNGWDVFNAHPELWSDGLDQLPGSIDNRSASEYASLSAQFGQSDLAASRIRQLMKLFVGPRGAITRMHQDNHRAHAWLCNLRGHKLYVVAAPEQSERVGPTGRGSEHGGTTRGCRLDPLDGASRGERRGACSTRRARPGETLVLPEGWWHYAASLTPSITLMCNWDGQHDGLRDCFCDAPPRLRPGAPPPSPTRSAGKPTRSAPAAAPRATARSRRRHTASSTRRLCTCEKSRAPTRRSSPSRATACCSPSTPSATAGCAPSGCRRAGCSRRDRRSGSARCRGVSTLEMLGPRQYSYQPPRPRPPPPPPCPFPAPCRRPCRRPCRLLPNPTSRRRPSRRRRAGAAAARRRPIRRLPPPLPPPPLPPLHPVGLSGGSSSSQTVASRSTSQQLVLDRGEQLLLHVEDGAVAVGGHPHRSHVLGALARAVGEDAPQRAPHEAGRLHLLAHRRRIVT